MQLTDPDLPEEFHEEDRREYQRWEQSLTAIGTMLAQKRQEAIKARRESGIEAVWMQCEEAYLCIDDLNRQEFARAKWAKPTSMQGPVTNNQAPRDVMRSTAFVRLTARYVDMGAAKVSEILLPIDDKAFSIEPTPIPDLIRAIEDKTPIAVGGQPVMLPGQPASPGMPAGPTQQATTGDMAKKAIDDSKSCADKAENRIYDWLVQANYPGEMRKVVHDAARIGVGVLKAPFPDVQESYALQRDGSTSTLDIQQRTVPSLKWVDPWNIFPSDGCGERLSDAEGVFERDYISARQLRDLKKLRTPSGEPIFIAESIDRVIKEGPEKAYNEEATNPNEPKENKSAFTIWYYTGVMKREDLLIARAIGAEDIDQSMELVDAVFTMVNDTVIRATPNPLASGRLNYHNIPWSRRHGFWAGVGVAEQVSMPQRMVNASVRAMLNNAGFSSGVQIIVDQLAITPADKNWTLAPNKFWFRTGEGDVDASKAFTLVTFPNLTNEIQTIIQLGYKMAEEATNIPLVTQGQQGPTTPDTFGAAELQNNNAHTLLRSIAYSFDDYITEPVVHQFYEWLLLDPDVPQEEKGDFKINARGSISMVEKAIQEVTWTQLLNVSVNPAFELSPSRTAVELLKSKRLDPRKIQLTDDEKAKLASAQQQVPPAPQVQAAQIREQGATQRLQMELQAEAQQPGTPTVPDNSLQVAQIRAETEMGKAQLSQSSDMEELRFKAAEADRQRAHEMQMQDREFQMKLMEFAEKRGLQLEEVKASLSKTAMQLSTQKELSAEAIAAGKQKQPSAPSQVATPPTEPAGRAPDGQAYQR